MRISAGCRYSADISGWHISALYFWLVGFSSALYTKTRFHWKDHCYLLPGMGQLACFPTCSVFPTVRINHSQLDEQHRSFEGIAY